MRSQSMALHTGAQQSAEAGVFLLILTLALLLIPGAARGEGCGGAPQTGIPSAYNSKANPVYGGPQLQEDPTWARYAHRGQAFENCPRAVALPEPAYSPPPVKKSSVAKRKSSPRKKIVAQKKATPPQAVATPCLPILMPVPAISVCPDTSPRKAQ